ncbi:MAG: DUF389 domain-containing protein, partial [Sphingomicrobium sp.]
LGLLLSSPAVVIGAMLISPMMGPIIGVGFALATFDTWEIRNNLIAIVVGTVVAVLFCAAIVLVSPLQTVTPEIASRTRPNLFDLLVALLSGLAATYAMIRGRHGAIVGVAIATALMPPIAVMGFGLATGNWRVLSGSSLLFFTNLMTIAAAAAVLARLYGFAADLSPRQTRLQATLLVISLLVLAVPLGLALQKIAWEALASREAKAAISSAFGPDAHLNDVSLSFDHKPIAIEATVLTPRYRKGIEQGISEQLRASLGEPVDLSIDQVRTADGEAADNLELAVSKAASVDRTASRISRQLAAVAGIEANDVLVDRTRRIAQARALPLPDASLTTYWAIERRIGAAEPGWSIELIPPLLELPSVKPIAEPQPGAEIKPDPSLVLAAWAGARTGVPIVVSGPKSEADRIAAALTRGGAKAEVKPGGRSLTIAWKAASGG